jgi:hypothetical protein
MLIRILSSTRQQKIIKTISAYIEMNYLLLLKFQKNIHLVPNPLKKCPMMKNLEMLTPRMRNRQESPNRSSRKKVNLGS